MGIKSCILNSLIHVSFVVLYHSSFRKTLNLTFTLRRCTAGWPAALQRRTPSSPASGSSTSVTWGRSWSLWTLVLNCWKVRELLHLFHFSTLDYCIDMKGLSLSEACKPWIWFSPKLCWFLLNSVLFFLTACFFEWRIRAPLLCVLVCGLAFCVKFLFILALLSENFFGQSFLKRKVGRT